MQKSLITELQGNSTLGYLRAYSTFTSTILDIIPFKPKLIKNHRKHWVIQYYFHIPSEYTREFNYTISQNSYERMERVWFV